MKKYLITMLLTGSVLCSFLNGQQVQYPNEMYVVANILNLRESPQLDALIIVKLKKDEKVNLLYAQTT